MRLVTLHKLVDDKTGRDIPVGAARETIRRDWAGHEGSREVVTIMGFDPPTEANPKGRVYARQYDGSEKVFFPTYLNAKIVSR